MKKLLLTGFALVSMATQAQTWVDQGIKITTSFAPREISIVDANTVWCSVYDGTGGGTYPKTYLRTINGGTTWTNGTIAGPPAAALVGDIAGVDANTAYVVTAPSSGTAGNGVYKTVNGGSSWTKQTAYSTVSFGNIIHFFDANNGVTAGDPPTNATSKFEVYTTSNGGTTWTANANAPSATGAGYGLTGVKAVSGNSLWFGTTTGKIARTNDKGLTWNIYFSPALDFGGGAAGGGVDGSSAHMAFKDANNGILITVDGAVTGGTPFSSMYNTTDGGATWNPVTSTGTYYFGDIAYVPGTGNTYVTTGIDSSSPSYMGSAYTKDGGATWISIDAGSQRGAVQFLNPTTGWAGQFSDGPTGTKGILKFSGNLLAVSDNAIKSGLQVYPNPASDVVTVSAKQDIKAISIIDLSGKRIQLENASGKVNVSSLPKGTYILQVYYGNGAVENTKLIKK